MGIVQSHRGRLAPALILAVLMALAAIVTLGLAASPASAQQTYTTCAGCHGASAIHARAGHSAASCGQCHTNGSGAAGVRPAGCASCHNVAAALGRQTHTSLKCGTTPGCHGFQSPTPTPTTSVTPTPTPTATAVATTMTLKAAPTIVRLNRTMKATGTAGPVASLAGAKVALKVERKVGTKWVKMKTVTKTVSAAGAFSWTYKAVKKGPHRVTASIAKTSTHTAKKLVRSFRVR